MVLLESKCKACRIIDASNQLQFAVFGWVGRHIGMFPCFVHVHVCMYAGFTKTDGQSQKSSC